MQGEDVFPIPGTKRIHYLEENVAALNIKLTAEDKQQLEAVFAADQVWSCSPQTIPRSVTHNCGLTYVQLISHAVVLTVAICKILER